MHGQSKTHLSNSATKIPRGQPPFAASQREKILELLLAAGPAGISRAALIFEHHYTQCGPRIDELKRQGFEIRSELRDRDRYVTYVLRSEPTEAKPLPTPRQKRFRDSGGDWQRRKRAKTDRRVHPLPPESSIGPLFAGGHK